MTEENDIFMLFSLRENLLHTFFYLLWAKARGREQAGTIRIPETVVLSHGRVIDWFFTAKDGQVKKKSRLKLNSQLVLEQFGKRVHKNKSDAFSVLIQRNTELEEGASAVHLNVETTRRFLTEGAASGTLQHFVEPKSESNVIHNLEIVCSWTPNVFYVERRQNTNQLTKSKVDLEDRTTLQETSRFVKVSPLVCGRTTAALEGLCQLVAQHVENVYSARVTGLTVHCKIDQNDDIWIMYASALKAATLGNPPKLLSITLATAKPSRSSNSNTSGISAVSSLSSLSPVRSSSLPPGASSPASSMEQRCAVCKAFASTRRAIMVPKRHVLFPLALIAFFAHMPPGSRFTDETLKQGEARAVPEYVKVLHPGISLAQYNAERLTEEWQSEAVPLCGRCSTGLRSVVAELEVGQDGAIHVPQPAHTSPSKLSEEPRGSDPVRGARPAPAQAAGTTVERSAVRQVEHGGHRGGSAEVCAPRDVQGSTGPSVRRGLPPIAVKSNAVAPRRAASSMY